MITLNQLADTAPRTEPWLLVVMTSTYTSNPPSNATAFKTWLERTAPGTGTWRNCRYLVWGLGNSQWNAFLAFPRYVQQKLADLGATPLADLGFGDVGSPVWERLHADWNSTVWPVLLELSGAQPTADAAERVAAENAADRRADRHRLDHRDAQVALRRTTTARPQPMPRPASATSIMRRLAADGTASRVMLAPAILTNAVGVRTAEARVLASQELQPGDGPKRTRQLDISLPPGVTYRAGDHLGVCPKNDEERVERLARLPRRRPGRAVHGAEDDDRPGRAEGRRAPGPQRAHQPGRHQRPPGCPAARPAGRQGGQPGRAGQADRDQGRPARIRAGWRRMRRCARRSRRAATTCSGCWTSSRPAR